MPGKRDDGDVGRAAADVDDHVARRLGYRHAGADGGGHRFFHQVHFARLRAIRAVLHGALLDLRDLRRHADDDAGPDPDVAVVRLLDEVGEHLLGDFEVGNDAVLHRLDRHDIARRAAEHLLGITPDRLDASVQLVDRHNRWLVHDDAFAARVHAGVGGAEIDREIARKERKDRTKTHGSSLADLKSALRQKPNRHTTVPTFRSARTDHTILSTARNTPSLPCVLHAVHGHVGRLDQFLGCCRDIGQRRDTHRRRQTNVEPVAGLQKLIRGNTLANALGHRNGAVATRVGQHQRKLVAAESRRDVGLARAPPNRRSPLPRARGFRTDARNDR